VRINKRSGKQRAVMHHVAVTHVNAPASNEVKNQMIEGMPFDRTTQTTTKTIKNH
jgi:hypothetical protein